MTRKLLYWFAIAICGMPLLIAMYAACVSLQDDPKDYVDDVQRKAKSDYALSVITDKSKLMRNQGCVIAAMQFLGRHHERGAIPHLILLLHYRRTSDLPQRMLSVEDMYPA